MKIWHSFICTHSVCTIMEAMQVWKWNNYPFYNDTTSSQSKVEDTYTVHEMGNYLHGISVSKLISGMWRVFPDFRIFYFFYYFFFTNLSLDQNVLEGKTEVACIVSKPPVSCLWGCGDSVNAPKFYIQKVQGALYSRQRETQACYQFVRICYFCQITPVICSIYFVYNLRGCS